MIFNSFQFIWLFPIIFILYWIVYYFNWSRLNKLPQYFLLIVSYGLYIQWIPEYALILLWVTLITYLSAIFIEKYQCSNHIGKQPDISHRKKSLCFISFTVFLSLLPLLCFKYINFIIDSGVSVLEYIGIGTSSQKVSWVLPLGLSFYTFQALGYLWDVYYGKIKAEKNLPDYMLFVAFFPQILCGPINSADSLLPQIKNPAPFDYPRAVSGLKYLLWGMFLKLVFADRLAIYVDKIYEQPLYHTGTSDLLASVFYSFQIYGDFAGYSFMALGVAKLLGFDIIKNFNRPYFATSVSMFWKRWNISLTRWLTTYIYIPLGGSRKGQVRTYRNILATFLVSGIWHGANWTFIFWGMIHGLAQCVEKFFGLNAPVKKLWIFPRIIVTFLIVNFAWIFFRMPSIAEGFAVIKHIFTFGSPYIHPTTFFHLALAIPVVFVIEILLEYRRSFISKMNKCLVIRWSVYLFLIISILTFGVLDSGQFIYISF